MNVIEAIRARKSIRAYKPDPIPKEVLREVLDAAIQAPSAMNTQPWGITVVTGEALDNLRRANVDAFRSGVPTHPETSHVGFDGVHRQRQVELAIQIFKLMGIAREDKQKRAEWAQRSLRHFDAPAAIILTIDKALDNSAMSYMDIGAIMQTICLAALKYGLGTCIEDQGIMYPELVRKYTGIPESRRIMIAIAIVLTPGASRIVRGTVLSIMEEPYIEAIHSVGARNLHILLGHVLPNVMAPIIVIASVWLGNAILIEASLSFLGLGTPPPSPSWGGMLSAEGRTFMRQAPWMVIAPGVAISLTVFAFNLFGDTLRDILDPRLRGRR